MSNPRLTEERLRSWLDAKQAERERMCLALLPLLGPYTNERPRRPKGGPDGGRDIEAIYQGVLPAYAAVGFKNGGGNDEASRREIQEKFHADLDAALRENPRLSVFAFFTNVDLTPGGIVKLKESAISRGVSRVDVFDFEVLRHILDSPEGLIPRLQYLELPMSATEQIGLVNKFGNKLQSAISSRFDRIEHSLARLGRYIEFQKSINRIDMFVSSSIDTTSASIGDEAILVQLIQFLTQDRHIFLLYTNCRSHKSASQSMVLMPNVWVSGSDVTVCTPCISPSLRSWGAYAQIVVTNMGNVLRMSDLSTISMRVFASSGICDRAQSIALDVNGFELFSVNTSKDVQPTAIEFPAKIAIAQQMSWFKIAEERRDISFNPPLPSRRFKALRPIS